LQYFDFGKKLPFSKRFKKNIADFEIFFEFRLMDYLIQAFRLALANEGLTQNEWARKADVLPSDVSKLLNRSLKSMNDRLWRALCNCWWKHPRSGLLILEARLKDEIVRAGRGFSEIRPVIAGEAASQGVDENLRAIERFIAINPDLYRLIDMMADGARKAMAGEQVASEEQPAAERRKQPRFKEVKGVGGEATADPDAPPPEGPAAPDAQTGEAR
jgi:hypothetical protein